MGTDKKICSKCKEEKSYNLFEKHKGHKDGYASYCKECSKIISKLKYEKNKEKILEKQAIKYAANKEENRKKRREQYYKNKQPYLDRSRKQREEKKEAIAIYKREWTRRNQDKKNASNGKRRAIKIQACPKWLDKDAMLLMDSTYAMARWLSLTCFQSYHVDHIVPLNSKLVCGLHVPWNLQIIPAIQNMSKGNKLEFV